MDARDLLRGATLPRDFGFTDEHAMLRDSARRVVRERFDASALRAYYRDEGDTTRVLHQQLASLGWTGLTLSEEHGGSALGMLHLVTVVEELGRALVPAQCATNALAGEALALLGRADNLPAIASGEMTATVALTEEHGRFDPDSIAAQARQQDDGWTLRGEFCQVPCTATPDVMIAPLGHDGTTSFFVVPLAADMITRDATVDPTSPTARVKLADTRVGHEARCDADSAAVYRAVLARGWLLLAAEALGAGETVLAMTRDYAIERRQFDKPIGSFQAVSHPIVDMMIALEHARSLVTYAAATLDHEPADSPHTQIACRMAKVAASEALWFATSRGVQLHGGFGFTWDCDMHFYFRRALHARGALGDPAHHRSRLAALLLGG